MIRQWWLRRHKRRHPDHVLVGWDGTPLRCGTCMGIPEPQLSDGTGFYREDLPRFHPARTDRYR